MRPPISAQKCHPVPSSDTQQCHSSVPPISAHQCQQCHLISATYQCHLISAASSMHISEG
ncbi:unnamed protein product, partial [Staurois parvus]